MAVQQPRQSGEARLEYVGLPCMAHPDALAAAEDLGWHDEHALLIKEAFGQPLGVKAVPQAKPRERRPGRLH